MLLGEMHATRVDDDAGHDGDRLVAGAALVAVAEVHSVHPLDHRPVEVGEAKSSWFGERRSYDAHGWQATFYRIVASSGFTVPRCPSLVARTAVVVLLRSEDRPARARWVADPTLRGAARRTRAPASPESATSAWSLSRTSQDPGRRKERA